MPGVWKSPGESAKPNITRFQLRKHRGEPAKTPVLSFIPTRSTNRCMNNSVQSSPVSAWVSPNGLSKQSDEERCVGDLVLGVRVVVTVVLPSFAAAVLLYKRRKRWSCVQYRNSLVIRKRREWSIRDAWVGSVAGCCFGFLLLISSLYLIANTVLPFL